MDHTFDVIITGCGPAGAFCALNCASNGLKTALVERKKTPGKPPRCAEGVTSLHLRKFFTPKPGYTRCIVDGMRLYAPNGKYVELSMPNGGLILNKELFIADILKRGVAAGVKVFLDSKAVGLCTSGDYVTGIAIQNNNTLLKLGAKVVVGADGVESRLGRWAGLNTTNRIKEIEPCFQYIVKGTSPAKSYIELFADNELAPGGYFWNFPHSQNHSNIGVVMRANKSRHRSAKEVLDIFLKTRFNSVKIIKGCAGAIPGGYTLKKITCNGLLLIGDAAHQVNPLTRAGILEAMRAGSIASEVITRAIISGDTCNRSLEIYKKNWDKLLGQRHKMLFKVKKAFTDFDNKILNQAIDSIKGTDNEEISIETIIKPIILKNPSLLLAARHFI
ncbi:MAG: NAD(P)/FAD-dependent oxidoreductase [bacterium]